MTDSSSFPSLQEVAHTQFHIDQNMHECSCREGPPEMEGEHLQTVDEYGNLICFYPDDISGTLVILHTVRRVDDGTNKFRRTSEPTPSRIGLRLPPLKPDV